MDKSPVLILLAGGRSSRMGSPKGLLDYHGVYWILEQIIRFKCVQKPKVYIGLGYDYEKYIEAIPWFNKAIDKSFNYKGAEVNVVINYNPQLGPFSTLQEVLGSVDPQETVIVQPIDVPLLNKQNLRAIINENNIIVIPVCDDHKGHPVKLKFEFWTTLLAIDLTTDKARLDRQIRAADNSSITYLKVSDNVVYQNINTQENWKYFLDLNLNN